MEPSADCRRVVATARAFATGRAAHLDRTHLASCGECRAAYRSAVRTAASLGRKQRRDRLAAERRERRATQRRLALSAGSAGRDRQSGYRLRTLLVPAFVCSLMVSIGRLPAGASEGRAGEARQRVETDADEIPEAHRDLRSPRD